VTLKEAGPGTPIRLVLVDDHPIVLQGLAQLFQREADFEVLACCPDGASALAAVYRHHPDVLLMDLRMPGQSGIDVLRALSARRAACRSVLLTAVVSDREVMEAVKLGVKGIVLKESPPDVLVDCVRRVHRGEQWIEREAVTRALHHVLEREEAARAAGETLTPREIEIVRMVAQGLRNKAIADRLCISEGTVKVHLHNVYEKLGVDGRLELVLCAQRKALI
jgi:two-component system, NarL family, nitrate/nitrite response regulator NarL